MIVASAQTTAALIMARLRLRGLQGIQVGPYVFAEVWVPVGVLGADGQ
jgi:hypothetical protein